MPQKLEKAIPVFIDGVPFLLVGNEKEKAEAWEALSEESKEAISR